jgi:hypothetical protein
VTQPNKLGITWAKVSKARNAVDDLSYTLQEALSDPGLTDEERNMLTETMNALEESPFRNPILVQGKVAKRSKENGVTSPRYDLIRS